MKYRSGGGFRRALETRLRNQSLESNVPLVRLRKMVAFDRLLARLMASQPGLWVLKGGLALQLRLGERARTTKDIDLLFGEEPEEIYRRVREAASLELGDWFAFEVGRPSNRMDRGGGLRHSIHSLLDGRTFERFHLDVGAGDPIFEEVEYLNTPNLLAFAEIAPVSVPCYPISQQLAEKVRAYTQGYASGRSSRVKDLVDMILLAEMGELTGEALTGAIEVAFASLDIHTIPQRLPAPPRSWTPGFRRLADEVGLSERELDSAYAAVRRFIDPVLEGTVASSQWHPETWTWE